MKNVLTVLILVAALAAAWYMFVYEKPGAVEKIGRGVDETIDKIRYGDETTVEKATRKTKEAVDEVKNQTQ